MTVLAIMLIPFCTLQKFALNFCRGFVASLVILFFTSKAFAISVSGAQTITVDGRLFSSLSSETALIDASVAIDIKILNSTGSCVLYEESQTVNTTQTDGRFTVLVGSTTGSSKRTGSDPGNPMAAIFQNSAAILGSCGAYTPSAGETRLLRMTIAPSTTGTIEVLSPDTVIDSVPNALVAETLQGLGPTNFVETDTASLTQANVANIFSATNYPLLTSLLGGTSSSYVTSSAGGAKIPTVAGVPSAPSQGQIWFSSSANAFQYYNGSAVQTLGISGSGISALTVGSSLTANGTAGGTLNSSGAIDLVNSGVVANTYSKVTVNSKGLVTYGSGLSESDIPTLTTTGHVLGDAIVSGTIGGATAFYSSGNVTTTGTIQGTYINSVYDRTRVVSIFGTGSSNSVSLSAPAMSADYSVVLPAVQGAAGTTLMNDGSGNLNWVSGAAGSVTSVGLSMPSIFSVTNPVVTSTGNLTAALANQNANLIFAGPASGVASAPTFRGLAVADLPLGYDASLQKNSLATGKIWIGNTGGVAAAVTPWGDIALSIAGSGTVMQIQGSPISASPPTTAGQVLRWNGMAWTPNFVTMNDLRSMVTGSTMLPSSCTANQTLTYNSVMDNLSCASISIADSQITWSSSGANLVFAGPATGGLAAPTFRSLTAADLPAGVASQWIASGSNIYYGASTGNVGVGTANPTSKFRVSGPDTSNSTSAFSVTNSAGLVLLNVLDSAAYNAVSIPNGGLAINNNSLYLVNSQGVNWDNSLTGIAGNGVTGGTSNYLRFTVNSADRLHIDSSGNVGIGSASPQAILDVNGTGANSALILPRASAALRPNGVPGMLRYNTDTAMLEMYGSASWASIDTSGGSSGAFANGGNSFGANASLGTNDASSLTVKTANTARMTIMASGNIGIGTTTPIYGLHLGATTSMRLESSGGFNAFSMGGSGNFNIDAPNFGAGRFTVRESGYIGIGSAGPTHVLDVISNNSLLYVAATGASSGGAIVVDNTAGGNQSSLSFRNANISKWQLGKQSDNSFFLYDAANSRDVMRVDTSSNVSLAPMAGNVILATGTGGSSVGIGTSNPAAILDVAGTGNLSAIVVPRDTTGNRPSAPVAGMVRYNTSNAQLELYSTGLWTGLATGSSTGSYLPLAGGAMTGAIVHTNGTLGTPSMAFADSTTGFYSTGPGNISASLAGAAKLSITSSGIGINTASPLNSFSVYNTTASMNLGNAPGCGIPGLSFTNAGGACGTSPEMMVDGSNNMILNVPTSSYFSFRLNNASANDALHISQSGNVGINSVNPTSILSVYTTGGNDGLTLGGVQTAGNTTALALRANMGGSSYNNITQAGDMGLIYYGTTISNAKGFVIAPWLAGLGGIRMDGLGNVGIGTNSPNAVLDVYGTTTANSAILIPRAAAANRPVAPVNGMLRYSTDLGAFEGFAGGTWSALASYGSGGGASQWTTSGSNIYYAGTGFVGIGTVTPAFALDVNGTIGSESGHFVSLAGGTGPLVLDSGPSGGIYFRSNATTGAIAPYTNLMILNSSGNLGIGETGPQAKLTVATNLAGTAKSSIFTANGGTLSSTLGTQLSLGSFGFTAGSNQESLGVHAVRTLDTATSWSSTAVGLSMDVDNTIGASNNSLWLASTGIGIGTYAPNDALDIRGNLKIGVNSGSGLIAFGDVGSAAMSGTTGLYLGRALDQSASMSMGGYSGIYFHTYDVPSSLKPAKMTITQAGLVGIGTTVPSSILDVYATGATSALIVPRDSSTARPSGVNGMIRYNTDLAQLETYSSGAWNGFVTSAAGGGASQWTTNGANINYGSGNVGIGTLSPAANLDVSSSSTAQTGIRIANTSSGGLPYIIQSVGSGTPVRAGNLEVWRTDNSTNLLTIQSSGNIGFGTSNPISALDMNGNIRIGPDGLTSTSRSIGLSDGANQFKASIKIVQDASGSGSVALIGNRISVGGIEVMRAVGSTGFVGIGTTSPQAVLDINGLGTGASAFLVPRDSSANRPNGINGMIRYNTDLAQLETYSSGAWSGIASGGGANVSSQWITNGSNIYYGSGNVGIATTTPSERLDVTGNINVPYGSYFKTNGTGFANSNMIGTYFDAAYRDHLVVQAAGNSPSVISFLTATTATSAATEKMTVIQNGNVGIGSSSPNSVLQVGGPISTAISAQTSNYTITSTDSVVLANATSGATTITLPTAVGIAGRQYTIKKTDSSANAVTVATTSSQKIDGNATYALSGQYQGVVLVSDGANWMVVSQVQAMCVHGFQIFTTSTIFVVPAGCTTLNVVVVGGGGGGGGGHNAAGNGAGGGAGGAVKSNTFTLQTGGSNISVTVGAGGAGGNGAGVNGSSGSASQFGILSASGGGGGGSGYTSNGAGVGGTGGGSGGGGGGNSAYTTGAGNGGTSGGNGAAGYAAGGTGTAWSSLSGITQSTSAAGAAGIGSSVTSSYSGGGGGGGLNLAGSSITAATGTSSGTQPGNPGTGGGGYGAGGGGATGSTGVGGNGAAGVVYVEY